MIPGDLLSAFPHRQFHTIPGLLDSWAALPNSNPNACMPMLGGSLYHFYDGLWYDPAERRTHDLPCERRTRYRLSQPDTVMFLHDYLLACEISTVRTQTLRMLSAFNDIKKKPSICINKNYLSFSLIKIKYMKVYLFKTLLSDYNEFKIKSIAIEIENIQLRSLFF